VGLAVALLKDSRGDIRLTVPVTGRLGAPEFSLRDAKIERDGLAPVRFDRTGNGDIDAR
jgi:hypothetical protein